MTAISKAAFGVILFLALESNLAKRSDEQFELQRQIHDLGFSIPSLLLLDSRAEITPNALKLGHCSHSFKVLFVYFRVESS